MVMDALEALQTRSSAALLVEPAPSGQSLDNLLKSAVRANDHCRLRPWKFLIIEGLARDELAKLFVDVARDGSSTLTDSQAEIISKKAFRAPLIIVVVACIRDHPSVPAIEQIISAGGAAQLIMVAAHAQGFAGIWRTGSMAYEPAVKKRLGVSLDDQIVGFLYLGTASKKKNLSDVEHQEFVQTWNG